MDNQLQSISKIFTEKLFRIPDYQRGYAWSDKQLKDFWNDILQLEDGKNHYVGVLTLERVPKEKYRNWEEDRWIIESKNYEPYYVVDGQQRLTTTIILIQSLIETVKSPQKLNYTSTSEIRKRFIFESKDKEITRSYIFGYEKDNPSYEFLKMKIFNEHSSSGYRKEITIYTHNLENAKNFFLQRLNDLGLEEKEVIYKKVTQQLLFNIYTITSDIDVFIAFETMNNRGKPLSNLELLKNRLIYLSTKFAVSEHERIHLRKLINDGWKGVYHFLGKNKERPLNDDVFLNNHCTIYYGKEIYYNPDETYFRRRIRLYQEESGIYLLEQKFTYKNIVSGEKKITIQDIKDYVESLQSSVEIWFNLSNPTLANEFSDEEKLYLDKLYRIGMTNFGILLIAFYLIKPKKEVRLRFLQVLERYSFIAMLTIAKYSHPFMNFDRLGIQLHSGELNVPDLITILEHDSSTMANNERLTDMLTDKFKNDDFYNWSGTRYFLFEYENHLKDKSRTKRSKIVWEEYARTKDDFVSIEHIYPQTAKDNCWKDAFAGYNNKEKKALCGSLGNLLPLSKPKNSGLQNKCFREKVDNDKNTASYRYGSYSENEVSKLSSWTPETILERGLKLLSFMENRWALDFKSNEKKIDILNLSFMKQNRG